MPSQKRSEHSAEAVELDLFVENDADLYRQMTVPIYKNLANKKAKGEYVHARAVDAFMHLMEAGAKKYEKEHMTPGTWSKVFTVAVRREVAEDFARYFEVEYDLGNWDHLLTKTAAAAKAKAKRPAGHSSGVVGPELHESVEEVVEHGRTWLVCNACGAQWDSHGEEIAEGDGSCLERLTGHASGHAGSRTPRHQGHAAGTRVARNLDPSAPLEGNGAAYFTVGGGPNDGDPESIALRQGEVPLQAVMHYMRRRLPGSNVQLGSRPGEVDVQDTDYRGKPHSYTSRVKVESRK